MSESDRQIDTAGITEIAEGADDAAKRALAASIAADWARYRAEVVNALSEAVVRRWAREYLTPCLPAGAVEELTAELMSWPADFSPSRRDRTTVRFVESLPSRLLMEHLYQLAGSNAASTLWDRIARDGERAALDAAKDVLSNADTVARETTLHLLVLDPYGESPLGRQTQNELLRALLDDPDPEVRGLAAEVIAVDMPDELLSRWNSAPRDEGERVRMAFWEAALVHRPEAAFEHGVAIALDPDIALDARRSALIAMGERVPTRQISPLLQTLLRGNDETLAADAAQLMWRHHRAPDVATAASESAFQHVRELAERLLHPERGSPAAGGSRPGDPTRTGEIFGGISQSAERERDEREQ